MSDAAREHLSRQTAAHSLAAPRGLSPAQAAERLAVDGANVLPTQAPRGPLALAIEVMREPMFLMLVTAGGIYLLMGETTDALMLLGFVLVVMAITFVQERRTERALDALRDLSSPLATVVRDGVQRRIPGRDVVRGDLIMVAEGDRVPADAVLRTSSNLSADESLLTGESVTVRKYERDSLGDQDALDPPGGDGLASIYAGTYITAGTGIAEVKATGPRSELGKIGRALKDVEPESTLLQIETRRLVRVLAIVGLVACGIVVVAFAWTRGGDMDAWRQGLLAGIAMAMATLPEEFPVVLTVFLALGAWRISKSNVLTRRMPAIETLGAATVLCVDKTGTLTLNHMTLRKVSSHDEVADLASQSGPVSGLSEPIAEILRLAAFASRRDPFDPMERAIHEARPRDRAGSAERDDWTLVREYELSSELLAVSYAWRTGKGDEVLVATKGAPEAVAKLCRLDASESERISAQVAELGAKGLRVLCVASASLTIDSLPGDHADLAPTLRGLIAFEDPLRPAVPAAVAQCRTAGIRVVMITGDNPVTAQSIALQAGIDVEAPVLTGAELSRMSNEELAARVQGIRVFARVVPQQKLRIVNALKAAGDVVAMTGDGVNDAPALKSAHIGIAMGGRGTDVARQAAALVLLDDDFTSIVAAVRLGRRIYDNIRKAIVFILAVHVPIVGLSMLPIFSSSWPLLLLPVHIVFLELVIDPSCTLVFEAEEEESNVMQRPPRDPHEPLFSRGTVAIALAQGLSILVACVAVFLLSGTGHSPDAARSLTFATLVIAFLTVILINRSSTRTAFAMLRSPNTALWWVLLATLAVLATVLFLPQAHALLHFAPIHPLDLLLALTTGIASLLWYEAQKNRPKVLRSRRRTN